MPSTKNFDAFRKLHAGPAPLLLANAWDAGSAALIESLGASAIATTSAGVCWSRGYADGGVLPPEELVAAARSIARVVRVPLSVDMETGYSSDPAAVARLAQQLVEAGAAGINVEDGAESPELLSRKIEAIRRATGPGLFINARTDVLLRSLATGEAAVGEIRRRATAYLAAGCDGIFVPGLSDPASIGEIARHIAPHPLNIMLLPGLPPADVLGQSGVRRLSAGSALAQAALGHVATLTSAFLAADAAAISASSSLSYGAANQLFSKTSK